MYFELMTNWVIEGNYTFDEAERRINHAFAKNLLTVDQEIELTAKAKEYASALDPVDARLNTLQEELNELKNSPPPTSEMSSTVLTAIRMSAENLTDEQLVQIPEIFDYWTPGETYAEGKILQHDGLLYRVVSQTVLAQEHQPPNGNGLLAVYAPIQLPATEGAILPWVYGETGIKQGDKREHKGVIYECQAPNGAGANVHSPDIALSVWKVVK